MNGHFWAVAAATLTAAPAQTVNGIGVQIDPAMVTAHTIGWLVKLTGVAVIAVAIL
jgi:hypothetical protein